MDVSLRSALPVWLVATLGGVGTFYLEFTEMLRWLPVVMAVTILLSFAIQLGLRSTESFIARLIASMAGAFVVLAVFTTVRVGFALEQLVDFFS